jgi:lysophospholipase L1-like esterase
MSDWLLPFVHVPRGCRALSLVLVGTIFVGHVPGADTISPETRAESQLPTLFIAGDSTAANGGPNAVGWGGVVGEYFDPARVNVVNRARAGRSSRTFVTEGLWDRLLADVKAGDTVLIQLGHNDGGPINGERIARGSLPGLGEETQEIDNQVTKQHEIVHTFGWYMRKMIAETKARGAHPILFSLTVRNIWQGGHVERGSGQYGEWTRELATTEAVPFVDLTKLVADHYETLGEERVKAFFPRDHTHTSEEGARLNARFVVSGLRGLRDQTIVQWLSATGRRIPTADPDNVAVVVQPPPKGDRAAFLRWLNLPEPGDPALANVFLIGDSTVRNGRGDGYDRQFGWGDPFAAFFDPAKINVVNRAVGGTGARSFLRTGYWEQVLARLKPGDVVIMQFGHNDNGARGALPGVGEETEEREIPDSAEKETVHTFGWYLRKYITDAREKGATPIVCSLVPRKSWKDGKIARSTNTHADWAREAAAAEGAAFIDLYELIAQRYDALGEAAVEPLFADRGVHTSWPGAKLNAGCVLAGLRALQPNPLAGYLR